MKKITLLFLIMLTWSGYSQLALEGFETWPPANWTIINNAGPNVTWTQSQLNNPNQPPYEGNHAAFLERENVTDGTTTEDWLVTPQFTVPVNPQLKFFSRLTLIPNNSNIYQIRITTDPNPSSTNYQIIQTWTEPQLNPSPLIYTEKIVNIPASYVGQQVYIAFVMLSDFGDRWLIDNVSVVEQCLDPTALAAANFTETTASLSWANPSGATSWEIEVVPAAAAPTGVGSIYNGLLPYTAPGLTQDTDYKYYVRALCTTNNSSQWVGPFNFSTVATGAVCSAPIVINTLPYSTASNTSNFGDDFDGAPGNGCGTTGNFLNGDEVVYAYTATFTGVISVNMTGNGANSAMFVYNSCANIGVSCVSGGTGNATTPVNLSSVSVISGTTYYIVISSSTTQSTAYNLTIQQVNCPPPTGLAAANMNATSANLTWNANGASSWEVVVQAAGAGIPVGAGTTTAVNSNYNVTQTTAGVLFTPATAYEYYVRADCGSGDGTFSAWTGPFAFMTTQVAADLNYSEGFEGVSGWSISNGTQVAKWIIGSAVNNGGAQSLYISQDNGVTNTYPIGGPASTVHAYRDIQMPSPVGQISLSFDWKSGGESTWDYIRVWSVPTTFVPTPGTLMTAANSGGVQIGGNFNLNHPNWTTANFVIDASAFAGQVRRIVFEWRNDGSGGTGVGGAIDNINISVITCSSPSALAVAGITQTSANVSWTPPGGTAPASYDYFLSTNNTAPTAATMPTGNVPGPTAPLTVLEDSTTYYIWVRSNCGAVNGTSFWVGPLQFNTLCGAFDVPFYEGFNSNSTTEFCWTVLNLNGDGDAWNMNYATTPFEGNQSAMLYTDFNNGNNNDWLISPTINLTGNQRLRYRYRVQAAGEPDAFEVLLSTAGTDPVNFTTTVVPLATYSNISYVEVIVNLLDGATPISGPVNIAWHVPPGGPDGWRIYIDNVIVEDIPTCPDPTDLVVLGTTTTTAQLEWTPGYIETAWQVVVQPPGSGIPTGTSTILDATTNPFTAPGLAPYTQYEYYVRANCGVDDLSNWVGPIAFTTSIGNDDCEGAVTVPVNPTAACTQMVPATFTGATASPQANPCTGVNGGDIWFEFTATNAAHDISLSNFGGTAQAVVLSLYTGDECGVLTNLMCSYTNVINATGLVTGTTYKVRAVLNSATPSLNTTFDVCVNTPPPPANSNQAECIITTINYDFELPEPPGPTVYPHFVSHHVVQGWRTTATDQQMEFWSAPNYENVPAYSGSQFIELNANLVSGVYQDYQTPQPTVFSYGFAHRGRQGTDTCQLLAGPPGGPYTPVISATTGNTAWVYYTGTYTVPAGQTVTRFIFQSVSSVGGASVGNYLDAITFTANNGLLSENPMLLDCTDNIANVSAAGVGTWSAHADNPGVTVIASAGSNDTTISGFTVPGSYRYDWTTQYCTSTLEVTYSSGDVPAPVAIMDVAYCTDDVATALTAEALAGNTLNWYASQTGGTPLAVAPVPDTAAAGSTIYYVSQSSPEGCESLRTEITVTVNEVPAAPVAQDVQYCEGDTATQLTAEAAAGNSLNWYTTQTGGTALAGAPTPDTTTANTTNYFVSQVAPSGCESSRTQVTVIINAVVVPVTGFTYTTPVCSTSGNIFPDTAQGFTPGGTFTSGSLTVDPVTGEIDMATAVEGSFEIRYEITAAGDCSPGGSTSFTITINNSIVPVTGFDFADSYCYNAADATPSLAAGFTPGGTFSATGGLIIDANTGTISISSAEPGSYTITYTIEPDAANCNPGGSFSDTFTVGNDPGFTLEGGCEGNEYVISIPLGFDPAGASYEWVTADGIAVGNEREFNVTNYVNSTPGNEVFPIDFMLIVSIDGCESSTTHTVDGISCNIQKGISPGDGSKNDSFDLSGLDVKQLSIFNRYGQEVFTYGNYTNQWSGQDKKGNELPTGTYFYSMERSNGETKTGWVYINRQN